MWQLTNRSPFVAAQTFVRDRDGREVLLMVVKATFEWDEHGRLAPSAEQVPIFDTPTHRGDPERSSLLHETDFSPTRAKTDVLLSGHARTLNERPSIAVEAKLKIGLWEKRIVVTGDRQWKEDLGGSSLTAPEPFVQMPLVYERAVGDADVNPVGVEGPFVAGRSAPNLEDPDDLITSPKQRPRPMSFGPIARSWPLRRRLAGTYDERWLRERRPLVPADFDEAFWQAAPPDQQLDLEGGEPVELGGMSATGTLRFRLPKLAFVCRNRIAGTIKRTIPRLRTVVFEPDASRVSMVYRSMLRCHHTLYTLEGTTLDEVRAERVEAVG